MNQRVILPPTPKRISGPDPTPGTSKSESGEYTEWIGLGCISDWDKHTGGLSSLHASLSFFTAIIYL